MQAIVLLSLLLPQFHSLTIPQQGLRSLFRTGFGAGRIPYPGLCTPGGGVFIFLPTRPFRAAPQAWQKAGNNSAKGEGWDDADYGEVRGGLILMPLDNSSETQRPGPLRLRSGQAFGSAWLIANESRLDTQALRLRDNTPGIERAS